MYLLKNALKNLGRNKGRNILIGLITLVIILAVSVSVVINTTVDSITKDYKTRFGAEVTLFLDTDIAKQHKNVQSPTAQQQMEIAKSDLLQKTEYKSSLSVGLEDLEAIDGDAINGNGSAGLEGATSIPPSAKVIASSDPSISEEFINGTRSIISGRIFEKPNECIVSEKFAKLNGLSVGDQITVTNTDENALMPHTLTICGIYEDNLESGSLGFRHPLLNRGNEIITDMDTALGMEMYAMRGTLNATYFLKDPSMLKAFQKEAAEKGLAPYYRPTTDEEAYNKIVGPVEGISKIVTIFLIVVLVFGGVILLFLSIMAIRERKYEIGVLRAMGMKRGKVITGMVCESLMIAALCLTLGLALSTILSQPIANTMLEDQIRIAEEQKKDQETFELVPGKETQSAISEISVQMNPQAILQIASLALVLVLISSMAGILYITRFEPMKILSERG